MLDDISAVKTWDKVNSGMIKMYRAEVLNKLPVMQHFLFGSILPYNGPPPPDPSSADAHAGHAHPHGGMHPAIHANINGAVGGIGGDLRGAGQRDVGWGDCCGIPVPSAFAAAQAEKNKQPGLRLVGPNIKPVPFD
jgi:serine/threonine-protein phosphatase 2A activator